MIFYWPGQDHPIPSGGVATHYEHVRHLNDAGIPASILHMQPGFRCEWFEHDVPIAYAPTTELGPSDVLVCNEILGPNATHVAPGIRKVTFMQNIHYTFRGWPIPPETTVPYRHPDFVASLVLTPTEAEFMRWVWPDHPVYVTPHGYDPVKWPLGTTKRQQIAFMPRKHADEAQQVFGYLRERGRLDGWTVVAIDGATQRETSRILQESAIFVAFGYPEGGCRPPFEAMISGCVVAGYGGYASDHDMQLCGALTVPSGDSCALVRTLDDLLQYKPLDTLVAEGRNLREWTLRRFSLEKERDAIVAAWRAIGV